MEIGKVSLDGLFDQAYQWCPTSFPAEPVYIRSKQREVNAIDSSTIARWRAKAGMDLLGKGYFTLAGKAVQANIVAVVTTIVFRGCLESIKDHANRLTMSRIIAA